MKIFVEQLVNGFALGGIYALIALGYTMVYGVLFMINFAHGEIFMIGAYFGLWVITTLGSVPFLPYWLKLIIIFVLVMIFTGMVGVLVERLAYKPLRNSLRLVPLISAIGVSLILQNLVMLFVSSSALSFPQVIPIKEYRILGVDISGNTVFIIVSSVILMVLLSFLINKTKLGKAIKATAEDMNTASLMGINPDFIIMVVFFIGAALGGVGGVLYGSNYGNIKYNMGFMPGIKAFTSAVVGGIGNIPGAMIGGYIIGIIEVLSAGYISAEYKDIITFVVLILMLLLKPEGILGESAVEKV